MESPLDLGDYFEELTQEIAKIKVAIQHIYREGNIMSDYLANLAVNSIV